MMFSSALRLAVLSSFAALALCAHAAEPAELIFPADVFDPIHFVDITKPPYNADKTGKEDAAPIIRQAIVDLWNNNRPQLRNRTLYFPNGTYRLTDQIDCVAPDPSGKLVAVHRMTFIGQSKTGVILRLDAKSPGFDDPKKPRGMIKTNSIGSNGNDAYFNCVWNMTLDVGAQNPGAAGVDYQANNTGNIRNLLVVAPDGSGFAGILLTRTWIGPLLCSNLEVDGFDYGVIAARIQYSATFEHLKLSNQRVAGIRNDSNAVFVRKLESTQAKVPAVINTDAGLLVLVDSSLTGTGGPAVVSKGGAFLRNVDIKGYSIGVENTSDNGTRQNAETGHIAEWTTHAPLVNKNFGNNRMTSLNLEVKEPPVFEDNDFSHWLSVGDFTRPNGNDMKDQSAEIQMAFDTAAQQGKTTIYFPPGQYIVGSTIKIYGPIRRVLGLGSVFRAIPTGEFGDAASPQPMFEVADLTGPSLEIDRMILAGHFKGAPGYEGVLDNTDKTLVLRNMEIGNGSNAESFGVLTGPKATGDLFLEAVVASRLSFNHPGQKIWARHLNPEVKGQTKIVNNGSQFWVLGLKTERPGIIVDSTNGAATEILGGLFHPVSKVDDTAILQTKDSRLSASYVTVASNSMPDFGNQIQETRQDNTQNLRKDDIYSRKAFAGASASIVPLVIAAPAN